jgi:hypothetical protein
MRISHTAREAGVNTRHRDGYSGHAIPEALNVPGRT